jgi:hypothetical protein
MDSFMQNPAPATTNVAQAMASLTRDGGGPMVITFYARDDADYRNLALALAAYADENARLAPRATANGTAPTALETAPDVPGPNVRPQQRAPAPLSSPGSTTMSGSVNNAGVITFSASGGPSPTTQSVNGIAASNVPAGPSDQSARANSTGAPNAYDPNSLAPSAIQQSAARGGPYRVALRPEQLTALAQSYRLAIVARAGHVTQFQDAGNTAPLTANADERATLLQKAGLGGAATAATAEGMDRAGTVTAQPAAPTVIDCVITMEPAPRTGP